MAYDQAVVYLSKSNMLTVKYEKHWSTDIFSAEFSGIAVSSGNKVSLSFEPILHLMQVGSYVLAY